MDWHQQKIEFTVMKTILLATVAMTTGVLCSATEFGRVISSSPVIQQVSSPREVCYTDQVTTTPQRKSGAGAIMGGIAGGALGNTIGGGNGKTAATVLGVIGGAMLGDNIEGSPGEQTQNIQRCEVQTTFENRTVAYNVVYEYAGKRYRAQMPQNPGSHLELQILPVGANTQIMESSGEQGGSFREHRSNRRNADEPDYRQNDNGKYRSKERILIQ